MLCPVNVQRDSVVLCALILAAQSHNVVISPRGCEISDDKFVIKAYESAASYCGVEKQELIHLDPRTIAQKRLCDRLDGPII